MIYQLWSLYNWRVMNQLSRDALIDTGDLSMGIRPNVGWISAEVWPFIKLEIGFYHTAIWDDSLYIYTYIYTIWSIIPVTENDVKPRNMSTT